MTIKTETARRFGKTFLTASLALVALPTLAAQCQNPTPIWADEFDGSNLDTSKWEVLLGDGCSYGLCGWGNNELQSYQAENLVVANGNLTISAKKQRVQAKNYTSGRIRTANMPNGGQWTNGRFEARIKLPDGSGMWPAFWMLPTDPDVGWPQSGEIDIVESTGQDSTNAFGTLHYGQPWPDNELSGNSILKQPDAWSDGFHEYAIEWEANEIRWYVDDILYSLKTPADMSNASYWTFENYQYHLILNMAVGGNLGGTVDDSQLPQTMDVDYVRVYDFGQPSLTGNHLVNPNSTETYSVVDEAGSGSSYSWSAPGGQTSNGSSFTVDWGTGSGQVTLNGSNSCGSYSLAMDVYVKPVLVQETVLDNFDSQRNLAYTSWNGTFDQVVANPGADAVNSSATVAQYSRDSGSQWDVIAANTSAFTDAGTLVAGTKGIYLDVYTAVPVGTPILVQLENTAVATPSNYPAGRHSKYIAHTTVRNGWQRLRFALEERIDSATGDTSVNSVVVLIDPDSFNGGTYYLDNFDIYGIDSGNNGGGDEATAISVSGVTTGTQSAAKGKKFGTATVTVTDNLGAAAAGISVGGNFSGSWAEAASGITDANGQVTFVTGSSKSGGVIVNFCVNNVSGSLPHDSTASTGLCQ